MPRHLGFVTVAAQIFATGILAAGIFAVGLGASAQAPSTAAGKGIGAIEVYKGKEIYEVSDELRERLHSAIMSKCFAQKKL